MKKRNLYSAVLILAVAAEISALDERIALGGQDFWGSLSGSRGTRLITGLEGYPDIVLSDSEYAVTEHTDLLIHFNTSPLTEETSRYRISPSRVPVTMENSRFGTGAGVFLEEEGGIELTPLDGALLAPGSIAGDFTIEFWLYPTTLQDGETVLVWTGNRLRNSSIVRQEIRCSVLDRKLVWSFQNFFVPVTGEDFFITLTPHSSLIPRQWHHHMLRFDSKSGLVEYLVDDRSEAVAFATSSGKEHPSIYLPRVGTSSRGILSVGPYFSGFMDEIRISRRLVMNPVLRKYQNASGFAVTDVVDLTYANSRVFSIDAVTETPSTTAIFFYYRTAEVKNGIKSIPGDWIPFVPGKPLTGNANGRFVQVRFELFTDGNESRSPRISRLFINYTPDTPPPPPSRLTAEPRDGAVILRWSRVPENDIAGYKIYYGTKPGVYFGTDAAEGPSPIDVGNTTSFIISGLENGRLYFFSVAAYDSASVSHTGEFSREANARPSRVFQ